MPKPPMHSSHHSEEEPGGIPEQLSAAAEKRLSANEDGSLDVMSSIGGWRGLAEAALPSAAFLVTYLITDELTPALVLALGMGAVFAVLRLVQRGSLLQSVTGLIGVVICAAFAYFSGDARGYYQPGFYLNAAYITGFVVSIAVKWPFMGILFGLIRGEGFEWRSNTRRRRQYALATWIVIAVLASRLVVQLPLYLADNVAALGVTRIVMGVPLYALGLWLGWMITRDMNGPASVEHGGISDKDQAENSR